MYVVLFTLHVMLLCGKPKSQTVCHTKSLFLINIFKQLFVYLFYWLFNMLCIIYINFVKNITLFDIIYSDCNFVLIIYKQNLIVIYIICWI